MINKKDRRLSYIKINVMNKIKNKIKNNHVYFDYISVIIKSLLIILNMFYFILNNVIAYEKIYCAQTSI